MSIEKLSAADVLKPTDMKSVQSYPVRSRDGHRLLPFAQVTSAANFVKWALGEEDMNCEALICEARPNQFCDLQTSGDSLRTNYDEMEKFRRSYNKTFEPIGDADVVILTLGLVECWFDTVSGVHLNR